MGAELLLKCVDSPTTRPGEHTSCGGFRNHPKMGYAPSREFSVTKVNW